MMKTNLISNIKLTLSLSFFVCLPSFFFFCFILLLFFVLHLVLHLSSFQLKQKWKQKGKRKPINVNVFNLKKLIKFVLFCFYKQNFYEVVQGGAEETQALLQERFDKVFYTGSPQVGRIVYQAAAKHLTPVTLELGGKSPAYFADDSVRDLDLFIQRFLFGKLCNLGQTCIAPDYILCSERLQKLLVERLPAAIQKEYGNDLKKSDRLARIVNERHTK